MNGIEIALDKTDLSILRLMQDNARITNVDLAREAKYGSLCGVGTCEKT